MEETEDEIEANFLITPEKLQKSKSYKNKYIQKKYERVGKDKHKINNIQRIFNQGISSNQPLKMVFTSDNSIKPLPLLSSASKLHNNNDEYLVINEEMKINKNILENNLFNLLKNKKTKSQKNIKEKNLFSSLLENSEQILKKDEIEKEIDSIGTEDQKSIESLFGKGKGTTSPSSTKEELKN